MNAPWIARGQSELDRGVAPQTAPASALEAVKLTRASDVTIRPIDWLWEGYLPRGMLTLLAGLPGCGKSTLSLALAATVTNAGHWPDGTPMRGRGSVLVWSSEDAADTVLTPRLMACGADLSRIHFVDSSRNADGRLRPFDPSTDMQLLQERVAGMSDLCLLILDPILSAVGGDSHKAAETRRGLQAVVDLAAAQNVAVLGISHFRKGSKSSDPAERVIGSQAFTALARMVLIASKVVDPEDSSSLKRIVARAKSNISPDDGGFTFHLKQTEVTPRISAQGITWGGAITGSALSLLNCAEGVHADPGGDGSVNHDAVDVLTELLRHGPLSWAAINEQAKAAGFSPKQMRTAKDKLGACSVKSAMTGGWDWSLAKKPISPEGARVAPSQNVGTFDDEGHLRSANFDSEFER